MAMSTMCYSIVGGVGACEDKSGSVLFPINVYNREGRVNREGVELNEPTLTHDLSASAGLEGGGWLVDRWGWGVAISGTAVCVGSGAGWARPGLCGS